jgi:periplasmic protein CpxP/Spy
MKPLVRYLLYALVVVLLVVNSIVLIRFHLGSLPRGHRPPMALNNFLIRELKLDAGQTERYQVLVHGHRKAADSLRHLIRASKERMFSLLKDPASGDSAWELAAREVASLTKALDMRTMAHFRDIRDLCRPDQQPLFDSLLMEVAARMAAGPPPGPPPPGFPPPPR